MSVKKGYTTFFNHTNEGEFFLNALEEMINTKHRQAEDNPENARDFTQQALGIRDVIEHIAVRKEPKSSVERSER
jgi:hypothetical protein